VRRETDAADTHVLDVGLVGVAAGSIDQTCSAVLCAHGGFFIAEHLEVVLENVDDFVR